jgi:hypothetical protein
VHIPKRLIEALGVFGTVMGVVVLGMAISGPRVKADDDDEGREAKIRIGFEIAPVRLNLSGKDRDRVGYGSYIVNAQADCNGCHTADPTTEFTPTGNPYLLAPVFSGKKKVNPATYLGGGSNFGSFAPGSAEIISRNLTPDKTGRPEGGHTYEEFVQIIRTGIDFDKIHPTCGGPGAPVNPGCVPWPFNGHLLQIMPWPTFQSMTDDDLRAIYEYLSAVPCVEGPPSPSLLHNDCH